MPGTAQAPGHRWARLGRVLRTTLPVSPEAQPKQAASWGQWDAACPVAPATHETRKPTVSTDWLAGQTADTKPAFLQRQRHHPLPHRNGALGTGSWGRGGGTARAPLPPGERGRRAACSRAWSTAAGRKGRAQCGERRPGEAQAAVRRGGHQRAQRGQASQGLRSLTPPRPRPLHPAAASVSPSMS